MNFPTIFFRVLLLITVLSTSSGTLCQKENFCGNKHFTIISAEETTWFGGVKGVKGKKFEIKLKNNKKLKYTFISLFANGKILPLKTSDSENIITIFAVYSETQNLLTIDDNTSTNIDSKILIKTKNWLTYKIGDSQKIYKFILPNFKEKDLPQNEELIN